MLLLSLHRLLTMGGGMFERITEPELMQDPEQALQYAATDFEEIHSRYPIELAKRYPALNVTGQILDVGCGPADITLRFAKMFPLAHVIGIDGSAEMLHHAQQRVAADADLGLMDRVTFKETVIPLREPLGSMQLIIANGMLHHLHDPQVLWGTISDHSQAGTHVFVTDLIRPEDEKEVQRLVDETCANDHPVHRADYYNSLRAAFTPEEVRKQLEQAGLNTQLAVEVSDDGRLIVHGVMG